MSRRKTKLSAKEVQDKKEKQWVAFDELLGGKIRISEEARHKWDTESQRERAKLNALKKKLKVEDEDDLIPIIVDDKLEPQQVLEIGNLLLDQFDPSTLDLTRKIDPAYMAFDHADRAPGVTDAQLDDYDRRIRKHLPSSLRVVTFAKVCKLLSVELAADDHNGDPVMEDAFQQTVEYKCFLPLMWFVQVMIPMPYRPEVKELYFDIAKTIASNTSSAAFREVWKHVISVYSNCKQDIADYLWHASKMDAQEEEQADKRAKQ